MGRLKAAGRRNRLAAFCIFLIGLNHAKGHAATTSSALLVVEHSGQGMDEHTREHAFDRFFTAKNTGKGAGLGPWSVFLAMRKSHGDVWIDSVPGKGTRIHLLLPIAGASMEANSMQGSFGSALP